MKLLAAAAATAAAILALASLPPAGAAPANHATVTATTISKGAANELRAGQRLNAPRFRKRVKRYQWLRCGLNGHACKRIRGATRRFYIVRSADVGHTLRVRAVLQGNTIATSAPSAPVSLPLPVNTALPTITDGGQGGGNIGAPSTVVVGDVLTGTNGTWKFAVRFTYQWLDCPVSSACTPIAGATTTSYTVQTSDVGDTIEFQVTAYNF